MKQFGCDIATVLLGLYACCFGLVSSYKEYSLENSDVCSPLTKRRLKLGYENSSAIVISQTRLNDHSIEWKTNSFCKFDVKVEHGRNERVGIFAVIQDLELRRDPKGGCLDYLEFKRRDGIRKKFCGEINAIIDGYYDDSEDDDRSSEGEFMLSRNAFEDPFGELDVYIFVSKRPLYSYERTEVKIVFTAYRTCSDLLVNKPCSYPDKCIYKSFFHDGFHNCPYLNCVDEGGCRYPPSVDDSARHRSLGNKVLIGSVTSLLVTFALFVCCIYVCRKYGMICWADEFARPTSTNNVSQTNAGNPPEAEGSVSPSAPPPDDKDLPPTYDSLFPSRLRHDCRSAYEGDDLNSQ